MMKKVICIMFVLLLTASVATADPIEVKNYSFETPALGHENGNLPDDWSVDGTDFGTEVGPADGLQCVFVGVYDGNTTIYQQTDHTITTGDEFELTFDAKMTWVSAQWPATVEGGLYYDDGGRVSLGSSGNTWTGPGWNPGDSYAWGTYTVPVTIGAGSPAIGKKLGIYVTNASTVTWGSWAGFDYIRLEGSSPMAAKIPDPYDGEELVEPNKVLGWSPPSGFTPSGYDVYLDPNQARIIGATTGTPLRPAVGGVLYKSLNQPGTTYDPASDLENNTWYYWRVDAIQEYPVDEPNRYSSIWSFKTLPEEPIINTHPQGQTVPATTDATFTVEADNATDYQWYHALTPYENDLGTEMAGKTDPSLTITGVGLGQEGYYYCNVANGATPAGINSEKALLMTERLFAQWTFENTIDAVVGGFTGTYNDPNDATPDPAYDNTAPSPEGGYAIKFDGDTTESEGGGLGESISSSEPNVFNFYPQGVTASAWVKYDPSSSGDWSNVVGKQHREDPTPWTGWGLIKNAGNGGSFTSRQAPPNTDVGGSTNLLDVNEDLGSTWHLVTGTYDGELTRIYVDGDLENQVSSTVIMDVNDKPLIIGAERVDGLSPMNGLIDDVQIYTHALSRVEVAKLYTDQVPGAEICTEDMSATDMDFNDDCTTDLKDLVEFAAQWLECHLVPICN